MTSINGTEYVYLNGAIWQTVADGEYLSGSQAIRAQRILTLRGEVMPTTDYDALTALEGQQVSVITCGYDLASDVSYYGCVIDSVTGTHDGPNMTGVTVSIKVSEV